MIKLIKATNTDTDFISDFNLNEIEDVYIILYNDEKVGVLEYRLKENFDNYSSCY